MFCSLCLSLLLQLTNGDVKIDDKISFSFPSESTPQESGGNQLWQYSTPENAVFLVMTVDFAKLGLDTATINQEIALPEFFDQYREGIKGKLPEGKLIYETNSTFKGHPVTEYKFSMNPSNTLITYYSKKYFIGTKVYSLSYIIAGDKTKSADCE